MVFYDDAYSLLDVPETLKKESLLHEFSFIADDEEMEIRGMVTK